MTCMAGIRIPSTIRVDNSLCQKSHNPDLPLVIGAGMKIGYDVLLWCAFRRTKPSEERA